MTADRRKRHLKILELISTRAIRTQEELAEALAGEGWEVTQSSVSRDIATLRLVKVDGAYRRPPRGVSAADPDERRIAEGVLTVESAGEALSWCTPRRGKRIGWRLHSIGWRGPTWSAPSRATTPSSWRSRTPWRSGGCFARCRNFRARAGGEAGGRHLLRVILPLQVAAEYAIHSNAIICTNLCNCFHS
jgi:hypothetical protein